MVKVDYKCKSGELLPANKYLRAVGDIGCPGSFALGYYMDCVKEQFQKKFLFSKNGRDCSLEFIKTPEPKTLSRAFKELWECDGFVMKYFSDDSCISIKCSDGQLVANLDISACDGSNYDPVFKLLKTAMSVDSRFYDDIDAAFAQLKAPMEIREIGGPGRILLKPKGHVLYSGSVLTTSVNNMANTLIGLAIAKTLPRNCTKAQAIQCIEVAANSVGYILKVDVCNELEDLQFLKHSPSFVDGSYIPWLNFGTMLRGLGCFRGDLPGSSKVLVSDRAKIFTSDVVKSYVHAGNTSVLGALQNKVINKTFGMSFDQMRIDAGANSKVYIPDEYVRRRYKFSASQFEEFVWLVREAQFGDFVRSDLLDVVFAKDYGY